MSKSENNKVVFFSTYYRIYIDKKPLKNRTNIISTRLDENKNEKDYRNNGHMRFTIFFMYKLLLFSE